MIKKSLCLLWATLLILCAGLGFIPNPTGISRTLMILLALVTFLPPAMLLYLGQKEHNLRVVRLIRNVSIVSLILTLVTLLANFAAVTASRETGLFLYTVLIIVSSPMICSQIWILSLILWAVLLWAGILLGFRMKKR